MHLLQSELRQKLRSSGSLGPSRGNFSWSDRPDPSLHIHMHTLYLNSGFGRRSWVRTVHTLSVCLLESSGPQTEGIWIRLGSCSKHLEEPCGWPALPCPSRFGKFRGEISENPPGCIVAPRVSVLLLWAMQLMFSLLSPVTGLKLRREMKRCPWLFFVQSHKNRRPTKNCHLPSGSAKMKSLATAVADLQRTLKGAQGGDQEWGTLCSGKNWQNRSSDS